MERLIRQDDSEVYSALSDIIGPDSEVAAIYHGALIAEAEASQAYALVATIGDAYSAARLVVRDDEHEKMMQEIAQLEAQLDQFDTSQVDNAWGTYDSIVRLNEHHGMNIHAESAVGQFIMGLINDKAEGAINNAPYADYASNNDDAWKYVPRELAEAFLSQKSFADTNEAYDSKIGYTINISSRNGSGLKVPSNTVVNAQGFSSWLGRADGENLKYMSSKYGRYSDGKETSFDTMRHYAGLPTELPSISSITLYVQPNGRILADNNGGDSHRLAAALLRGDEYIKTEYVSVRLTSKNILP